MKRLKITPRHDWQQTAANHGFTFHTPDNEEYWRENICYEFTEREIEDDLEDPAEEIEAMCFDIINDVIASEEALEKLQIPKQHWDYIAWTWQQKHKNIYGRMDFSYGGAEQGAAKFLEYNADTPTSLYETAIFQWIWLEQAAERGLIPARPSEADQFNSLHERLIDAYSRFEIEGMLHLACAKDSDEDFVTIEYMEECAKQAGLKTHKIFMEDIAISENKTFLDGEQREINTLFKLYPWEWMFREEFAEHVYDSGCTFIEPAWKAILSNKGLLPLLWEKFEGHPNLLPAFFDGDAKASSLNKVVKKPIFSREGWNISIIDQKKPDETIHRDGPYGEEGFILQEYHPLPNMDGAYPMCGVWMVASQAAGMLVREDANLITTDDACFTPHFFKS